MRYICMKILSTSTNAQVIKVIPREYVTSATLKLTDDSSNTSVSYSITPVVNKNLLVITQALALKEGRFYNLTLSNSVGTSIYKDKVFCTAQDIDQSDNDYYTINKDTYTSDTTYDNDFIII